MGIERGSTGCNCVKNWPWKNLWICLKAEAILRGVHPKGTFEDGNKTKKLLEEH